MTCSGIIFDSEQMCRNAGVFIEKCFPLIESSTKNFLKLYLNDVGILTGVSNSPKVVQKGAVLYLPIYFAMFL